MKEQARYWLTMGMIGLTLTMVVVNYFIINNTDDTLTDSHKEFFSKMLEFRNETKDFMSKGGRNTAQDGNRRDAEIAILKMQIKELQDATAD